MYFINFIFIFSLTWDYRNLKIEISLTFLYYCKACRNSFTDPCTHLERKLTNIKAINCEIINGFQAFYIIGFSCHATNPCRSQTARKLLENASPNIHRITSFQFILMILQIIWRVYERLFLFLNGDSGARSSVCISVRVTKRLRSTGSRGFSHSMFLVAPGPQWEHLLHWDMGSPGASAKVRSVLVAFRSTLLKTDLLAVFYFAVRVLVVYLPKKVHCKNNRDFNSKKNLKMLQ